MMKRITYIILLAALVVFTSCLREKQPEEIYNEQASGVVLVLNQFYYSATLSDGSTIYFSGLDEDGDLKDIAFSADSVQRSMAFGTAFFVDGQGSLLTNRHVVDPIIAKSDVKGYVKKLVKGLKAITEYAQSAMAEEYQSLQEQINANTSVEYNEYLGYYTTESIENNDLRRRQSELSQEFDEAQEYIEQLEAIDVNEISIQTYSEIGIAYHDTYVTKPGDFKPCVVVRTSQDQDVDLALIRLKDKTTPSRAHIFSAPKDEHNIFGPSKDEREKLALNQSLVLIGYNHGVQLAATQEGIKAQLTTGNVSQQPDGNRVMYTIPMLQGSSGSPVVNRYGELVAVNFAGLIGTQSFNFGIPLKRINDFLKQ